MTEPKDRNLPPPGAYTRLPNGEWIEIGQVTERMRRAGEAGMTTAHLRSGDMIVMYQAERQFINFEIKSSELDDLGVSGGFCPTPNLIGTLSGDVPDSVRGKKILFGGSGFGGGMRQPDLIATGRIPYFFIPGQGEFHGGVINNYDVLRRDQTGKLRVIEPNQLDAEARKDSTVHAARLEKIGELMHLFGFDKLDFRDGTKPWPTFNQKSLDEPLTEEDWPLVYEDDRYKAQYMAGMATGNQLAVFDKERNVWIEFKYFNYQNDDFLQIAFADLTNADVSWLYDRIASEDMSFGFQDDLLRNLTAESLIHTSGEPIITHATSGRYGINAINYHLGNRQKDDLEEALGLELRYGSMAVTPDIQLWPDGEIKVAGSFMDGFEGEHPGATQTIKSMVITKAQETLSLRLGEEEIKLPSPDEEIDALIQHLQMRSSS